MNRIAKSKKIKYVTLFCMAALFFFCLMQSSSTAYAKWVKTDKGYRYTTNASGTKYYKNKWVKIKGKYYFFNKKGYRTTGWLTYKGNKYYLNRSGIRVTGFDTINKKKYYFNKNGVLQKGWIRSGSYYYHTDDKGVIQTGIQTIGSYTYYFDSEGKRLTNANLVFGNLTYYFADNGTLQYTGTEEEKAVKYINAYRMSKGYEPLQYHIYANLSSAATRRATELASNASHTRPDGTGYHTVIERDFPLAVYWSGECIIWGKPKEGTVVASSWLSDGNRAVLLQKKANSIGIARYVDNKGCEYWSALIVQTK